MNQNDNWEECREMLKRYYQDIEGQIAKLQQKMDQLENLPQQQGIFQFYNRISRIYF